MLEIKNLGPKKVKKFYKELEITNIEELKKAGGQLDNYYLYDKKGRLIVPRKLIKQKAPAVKKKEETTAGKKKEKKAKKQKTKNKMKK